MALHLTHADSQYVDLPSNSLYDLQGDFTIEFYLNLDSYTTYGAVITKGFYVDGECWGMECDSTGQYMNFQIDQTGGAGWKYATSGVVPLHEWHHYAGVYDSVAGTMQLFVDGYGGTKTTSVALPNVNSIRVPEIGRGDFTWTMDGAIQGLRISKNVRYTTDFTPPTTIFTDDANTIGLFNLDGDTKDGSIYGLDGTWAGSGTQDYIYGELDPLPSAEVLVVAGGGGGGGFRGAGGGAGGLIKKTSHVLNTGSYLVTVGDGGAAGTAAGDTTSPGGNGNDSIFDTLHAIGGGGGGSWNGTITTNGGNGGSGGGGGLTATGGDSDYIVPKQGYDGGAGYVYQIPYNTGGGGGAGAVGQDGQYGNAGNGGVGVSSDILHSGSSVYYAGGGGGGATSFAPEGSGGSGGGGAGTPDVGHAGSPGTSDTGGGGGGAWETPTYGGGKGGSGIVIIRYLTADFGTCTGGTKTTDGAYTVHKFVLANSGTNFVCVV